MKNRSNLGHKYRGIRFGQITNRGQIFVGISVGVPELSDLRIRELVGVPELSWVSQNYRSWVSQNYPRITKRIIVGVPELPPRITKWAELVGVLK